MWPALCTKSSANLDLHVALPQLQLQKANTLSTVTTEPHLNTATAGITVTLVLLVLTSKLVQPVNTTLLVQRVEHALRVPPEATATKLNRWPAKLGSSVI
jgi:hypothetical protein